MTIVITLHELPGAVGDEWTPLPIDWTAFCSDQNDYRRFLHNPWHEQGVTYASNGAAICAIPGIHTNIEDNRNAANLLTTSQALTWHPIDALAINWHEIPAHTRSAPCDPCKQTGKAALTPCDGCKCNHPEDCYDSTMAPHDSETCPYCFGHGMHYPSRSTYLADPLFDGMTFQSHLLRPFIDQFTNIELAADACNLTLHLRFSEGRGVIAPVCSKDKPAAEVETHNAM